MISLSNIKNDPAYLAAVAALSAENINASTSQRLASDDGAKKASAIRNIKEAITNALASRENEGVIGALVERDPADVAELHKLETFDKTLEVWAGRDESYTYDDPVIYLEVRSGDDKKAYSVRIDDIDATKMSRLEALALMRYMQSDPEWSDISYADMMTAIAALYGNKGVSESTTNSSLVDQIGRYLKSSSTYTSGGTYSAADLTSASSFFEQTRSLRQQGRAMKLQSLINSVVTNKDGSKTLADGFYL